MIRKHITTLLNKRKTHEHLRYEYSCMSKTKRFVSRRKMSYLERSKSTTWAIAVRCFSKSHRK